MKIQRALLSVTDKSGLVSLANFLHSHGVELVSTGGTAVYLREEGLPVTEVSSLTGFPEILNGRVKTLHPSVFGGILADRNQKRHHEELTAHSIGTIDLVCVNLYDFAKVASRHEPYESLVESIDIGGVSLLRAGAKNALHVCVLSQPSQYTELTALWQEHNGNIPLEIRQRWAIQSLTHTARYDALIAQTLTQYLDDGSTSGSKAPNLEPLSGPGSKLRYGENPHEEGWLFPPNNHERSLWASHILQGKELSFNNWLDLDAAARLLAEWSDPACVIIKHNNPCGVAAGSTLFEAWDKAVKADPLSAFGGVVALNRPLDVKTALAMSELFLECLLVPSLSKEAAEYLAGKKNLRVLVADPLPVPQHKPRWRELITGGWLAQSSWALTEWTPRVVSSRQPTADEWRDLEFAWRVCRHVKSNAIVLSQNLQTRGIGAGQMSRIDSVWMAVRKAGDMAQGSVAASDAFFPFPDSVDALAKAGVKAIVQPGGSIRDAEVIEAAKAHGLSLVFTGARYFLH